jgi:hypothetical protein
VVAESDEIANAASEGSGGVAADVPTVLMYLATSPAGPD